MRIARAFCAARGAASGSGSFSAEDPDERLAWLIVLATIPVGITGLALEHVFRTVFAKPVAASVLLFVNGLILLAGERARRRTEEDPEGLPSAGGDEVPGPPPAHGQGAAGAPRS